MTRRDAVLFGLGTAAWGFAPGEFWNEKEPGQWSDKEVERILTRSPWAKEVRAEMNMSGMRPPGGGGMGGPGMGGPPGGGMGGPGMGGGGMGGPPGGGMGGPGMGGPGGGGMGGPGMGGPGGGMPEFKMLVRWESATPVREAGRRVWPKETAGHYILSVSGLPGGGERGGNRPEMAERRTEMMARLKESTRLQCKGKEAMSPIEVMPQAGDGSMVILFAPEGAGITVKDKDVTFVSKMGPLEVKAKFVLKDMLYRGELAI